MKKTNLLSATLSLVLALPATTEAQTPPPPTGSWNGSTISTHTNSAVGIGIPTPLGHQEIQYCDDQQYGFVVTKKDCGVMVIPPAQFKPTYDGMLHPLIEFPSGSTPFTPPINFQLTAYQTFSAKPLIWARTQNPSTVTGASGPYSTQFVVTPYGTAGINIENPRATLDVKGLGGVNVPTMIVGRQAPGTTDKTAHIHFVNLLGPNGYNSLSQQGDQGIFFTDGLGASFTNANGGLVLAPWTPQGSSVGGIRITNLGDVEIGGSLKVLQLKVRTNWWNDVVFSPEYQLMPLPELESYVRLNRHLPGVPSEKEMVGKDMDVADMMAIQMGKIEELTLYMIGLQKQLAELELKLAEYEKH